MSLTKPSKYTYQIQYKDQTYRIVEWTKAEFKQIGEALMAGETGVVFEEGIFLLGDIRTIVFIPPTPEPTEEEIAQEQNELSEWGFLDRDSLEWLKANGVDISKGVPN